MIVHVAGFLYANGQRPLDPAQEKEVGQILASALAGITADGPVGIAGPMRARGGGSIVNISSSAGVNGEHGVAIYSATKWGLRGLAKSASLELGQFGICINCVCPSGGSGEMLAPYIARLTERMKAGETLDFEGTPRRPMGRNITLREIAHMVLFLASDESSGCNGGDFVVDCGYTVGHVEPSAPGAAPNRPLMVIA